MIPKIDWPEGKQITFTVFEQSASPLRPHWSALLQQ
jgi:hypothetical protein